MIIYFTRFFYMYSFLSRLGPDVEPKHMNVRVVAALVVVIPLEEGTVGGKVLLDRLDGFSAAQLL